MRNSVLRRAFGALFVLLFLVAASPMTFSSASAPYTYSFPRDHAAHDSYRTEWWYFTGHLKSPDGHRFGYELTFFRFALEPHASRWSANESKWFAYQLYPAHFAISNITAGNFTYHETLARDALEQGFAREDRFVVGAGGWRLDGTAELRPRIRLRARKDSDALDLSMQSVKPPAIHGVGGISRKGPCASCASHYYSFTRLQTSGTLTSQGVRYSVDGESWMDHEFGSDELQSNQTGWDWFSLQLRDGREVMLYRLRQQDGSTTPQSSGSLVSKSGAVQHLTLQDFSIASTGTWKSPHTNASYPSGWRLTVKGIDAPLEVIPLLADQELAAASGTTYWEGASEIRNARTGEPLGEAYVELTGYTARVNL